MNKPNRRQFLQLSTAAAIAQAAVPRRVLAQETSPGSDAAWPDNPFLQGGFAPVFEEITAEQLKVVGRVPDGLEGMYVRNGANPQFPPRGKYHWFDGDGMLHGVRLADGRASYRNRYVLTQGLQEERQAGKALWTGLAEPIDFNQVLAGRQPIKNAANTALVWHGGRLLALWEGGPPYEVRLPDLETVGPDTLNEKLKHPFTAHPKIDQQTGEMVFFGYSIFKPYLQHSVADASGNIIRTTPIELPGARMMHDFAITQHYSIFMDLPQPASFSFLAGTKKKADRPSDQQSRFGILPRHADGHQIRWFDAPPCFIFHTLNAFEQGNEVVLDACRMPQFPEVLATTSAKVDPLAVTEDSPRLHRWRFNLKTGQSRDEPLDDMAVDFPRINDVRMGRMARFGYASAVDMTALVKYDLHTGQRTVHRHGQGRFGGEGLFVPDVHADAEDAGYLLAYVHDRSSDTSELVVIDTRSFESSPVARVLIPSRIPYGFHGAWIPAGALPQA